MSQFGFCQELQAILDTRRVIGRTGKCFDGLNALSTENNLRILRSFCMEFQPRKTLEVGLSFGGSALVFTASHRDIGSQPQRQHVAIDPFQLTVWDDCGLLALERAELLSYLDFRGNFSAFELPKLYEAGDRFDLVYIDGSHLFEDVFVDAYYLLRLLSDKGIVTFDDSSNPNVAKVLQFIRKNYKDSLEELDLTGYRQSNTQKFAYRLARKFGKAQFTAFRRLGKIEREWNALFHNF